MNSLSISHNKDILGAAAHHYIRLYNVENPSHQPIASLDGHTQNIMTIGFQKDDQWIYSGSEDKTIKIWDLRTMQCQREYKMNNSVNTLSLNPNQGELVSGDEDGNVWIWDLTADKCVFKTKPFEKDGFKQGIRCVNVSADGTLCVASNNKGNVVLWKYKSSSSISLEQLYQFKAHNTYILKSLISPDIK